MRGVARWLRTQQGLLAVILSVVAVILVATWFRLYADAEREAAANASRIAAVAARDAAQEFERLDLTSQTVVGGRQSAADTHLGQLGRSAAERASASQQVCRFRRG